MYVERWIARFSVVLGSFCALACSALPAPNARPSGERIAVPDEVTLYSTEPTPNGVLGGAAAADLGAQIATELAARGTSAEADGALAATASWVLREMNERRTMDQLAIESAARRFGFAGVIQSMAGFSIQTGEPPAWRDALKPVPPNMPITRYGVSVAESGRSGAVVLGAVEASLAPIPRHLQPGERVELRGEVARRFTFGHVYLTKSDGSVEEKRMPTRKVDASFTLPNAGVYRVEVMGDGPMGPVVVVNVPLYVGAAEEERSALGSAGNVTSPAEGEARMLELLNQTRKTAALDALQADDELRQIAWSHSTDMVEHHFFGHVSPTTGTPEDRARRSGVVVAAFGENVAQAPSAERAFDSLMASPGHRANMLSSAFTHVGIAARVTDEHQLVFTLNFGRRPNPAQLPRSAGEVQAAFLALRAQKGLSKPAPDAIYAAAADAGARAYAEAGTPSSEVAMQAGNAALAREVQRAHSGRPAACSFLTEILELKQLEQYPILLEPEIRRFGIGARLHEDAHGPRLALMMLLEGAHCR